MLRAQEPPAHVEGPGRVALGEVEPAQRLIRRGQRRGARRLPRGAGRRTRRRAFSALARASDTLRSRPMACSGSAAPSTSRMKNSRTAFDSAAESRCLSLLPPRQRAGPAWRGRPARCSPPCPRPGPGPPGPPSSGPPRLRRANLREPIPRRRRARLHRLVGQVAHHVGGEVVGRLVPPPPVLLQRLHHDPVQLAAHRPVELPRVGAAAAPRRSCSVAPSVLSRVLGLGGSSSRMIRRISSKAAFRSVSASNGVVPVSSS